jgi:polysaccharide deacetylase 2 family uncharacterized protein YibQ
MARSRRKRGSGDTIGVGRLLLVLAAVLVALGVVSWLVLRGPMRDRLAASASGSSPEQRIRELAVRRGAQEGRIRADDPIRKIDGVFVRTWHIELPDSTSLEGFVADVEAEAERWRATAEPLPPEGREARRLRIGVGVEAFDLRLGVARAVQPVRADTPRPAPTATPRPQPPPGARGRLAILLDDGGQSMDLVPRLAALDRAVGISILPFLPYSAETAARVSETGHQVWLHLPMEPDDYPASDPGPGAVLVSMSETDIRTTVRSALGNVPHVVGVNNHMGSKATADLRTMTWVMQEIATRGLAFIDSRTTVDTVAEEAARAQGVPVGRRHVFLDNERTPRAIRAQIEEAVYRCRMEGELIAIGHVDPTTVAVLETELPGLARRGADLVLPTDLLR